MEVQHASPECVLQQSGARDCPGQQPGGWSFLTPGSWVIITRSHLRLRAGREVTTMEPNTITGSQREEKGLSSAKREDIWALIIALVVLALAMLAPDAIHSFFEKGLYFL